MQPGGRKRTEQMRNPKKEKQREKGTDKKEETEKQSDKERNRNDGWKNPQQREGEKRSTKHDPQWQLCV